MNTVSRDHVAIVESFYQRLTTGDVAGALANFHRDSEIDEPDALPSDDAPVSALPPPPEADDEPESVSADATPCPAKIAAPIPRATAKLPTRPTYVEAPIAFLLGLETTCPGTLAWSHLRLGCDSANVHVFT